MDLMNVLCLGSIIIIGLIVNTLALVYFYYKNSINTLKDRVVISLCLINLLQSVGFGMELNAAINGRLIYVRL